MIIYGTLDSLCLGKKTLEDLKAMSDFYVGLHSPKKKGCDIRHVVEGVDRKTGEKIVTVVFKDGKAVRETCRKGDAYDLNVAVALAYADWAFGSKTQFHKAVKEKTCRPKLKKPRAEQKPGAEQKPEQ